MSYILFLVIFCYIVLVRMPEWPGWHEWFIIAYVTGLGCEKVREVSP